MPLGWPLSRLTQAQLHRPWHSMKSLRVKEFGELATCHTRRLDRAAPSRDRGFSPEFRGTICPYTILEAARGTPGPIRAIGRADYRSTECGFRFALCASVGPLVGSINPSPSQYSVMPIIEP
jgi:hypothetical protein